MKFEGKLLAIAIARQAKGKMEAVDSAQAVAEQGLVGDRYYLGIGAAQYKGRRERDKEVTLIAREAIEAASDEYNLTIDHLDTRRNLLTEGVPLNDLVTKAFRVGPVLLRGLELCEPCGYLERQTYPGIKVALKHRGGLRCAIVEGGELRVGDVIRPAS